jgi:hypothetical protein
MNSSKSSSTRFNWSRCLIYVRLAVCLLLLPLLVTGLMLVPEARSDFVATTLIITCCLYIDASTLTRQSHAKADRAR